MKIHDGQLSDTTNIDSNSYLQINSCGIQVQSHSGKLTYRKQGRRDYHIIYIIDGSCEVEYNGTLSVLKRGFVLYPPHMAQRYIEQKDTKKLWIHFNGYSVEEILKEANLSCGVHHVPPSPVCEKIFVQLVAEHNKKIVPSNAKGLLLTFLCTLGKSIHNIQTTNEKIDEAISFITMNYNMEISTWELATSCNLSESRFMHLFKERVGHSPHSYQQTLRINNSLTLLASTQLSITDISMQIGYTDPLYFSRVFKKHTGMSPKQYRATSSQT